MSLKLHRIFHAGYVISDSSTLIIIDPILESLFSYNCIPYPSIKFDFEKVQSLNPDAIFISHVHDDHFSLESLNQFKKNTPIYIYANDSNVVEILKKLGFQFVYLIEHGRIYIFNLFQINTYKALDADVDCLIHIQYQNINILNVVDSWIDWNTLEELKKHKWNLILWPFQQMQEFKIHLSDDQIEKWDKPENIIIPEHQIQIEALKTKALIPSSCQFILDSKSKINSNINSIYFPISYSDFINEVFRIDSSINCFNLLPGGGIEITENSINHIHPLSWIQLQENQYEYKFPIIQNENNKTIWNNQNLYEVQELNSKFKLQIEQFKLFLKNFKSFIEIQSNYQLKIIIHNQVFDFDFIVDHQQLKEVLIKSEPKNEFDTSVCIDFEKWILAFDQGIQLNALDLQFTFSKKIKKLYSYEELILNDPLISYLYNNKSLNYQYKQLDKILNRSKKSN